MSSLNFLKQLSLNKMVDVISQGPHRPAGYLYVEPYLGLAFGVLKKSCNCYLCRVDTCTLHHIVSECSFLSVIRDLHGDSTLYSG